MQQVIQKESHEAVKTIYVKEKVNTSVICYVVTWMKIVSLTVLSFTTTALSHCFSFLSAFFILSHFKIIRGIMKLLTATSTNFLLKCNWKKKTWKMFFERPNRYTGLPNGLNTSLVVLCSVSWFSRFAWSIRHLGEKNQSHIKVINKRLVRA